MADNKRLTFDANVTCPKCTNPDVRKIYSFTPYQNKPSEVADEWLACKCNNCGYAFEMMVAGQSLVTKNPKTT